MSERHIIKNFPDYKVDKEGNVYSYKSDSYGLKLKPRSSSRGYLSVALYSAPNEYTNTLVHRIVAEAFVPNPENKEQVNHKDGNKANNKVNNLEWCSRSENIKHAFKTGMAVKPRGERNGMALLSEVEVREIRSEYAKGFKTLTDLGEEYGVSYGTIYRIVKYITWKHVD